MADCVNWFDQLVVLAGYKKLFGKLVGY